MAQNKKNKNKNKDKELDLQLQEDIQQLIQQLIEAKERTKEVTQQFENATEVADLLVQKIHEGSSEIDNIGESTLRWKVGFQRLSKEIGFVNDQVVDYSKHLIQIKQQHSKLSNTAKQWLSSISFDDIVEGYKTSLSQFRGMFFTSFSRMSDVALQLGKNFTELGQQEFENATNSIKGLDEALNQASRDYSLMVTKVQWESAVIQQQEIMKQLQQIGRQMENIDKTNEKELLTYIEKVELSKQLQKELEKQNNIIKYGRIVTEQTKQDAKEQLQILQHQRNVMYDMNALQLALNEKLKPFMEKIDQSAQKLNQAKQGIGNIFNVIGIDLVGIEEMINKIDFGQMVKPLKTMISTTTMQFALGFKAIKEKGIHSFKDIAKAGHGIFKGLVTGIGKMFFGLFSMLTLGLIASIGAMVSAAIRRSQQLAQAFNSAQASAGALKGQMADFSKIYSAFGGQLGGQKAAELYSTMLKLRDVTVATAKQAQLLQRHYGVSVTNSAAMLQNMRNIMGMTEKASNNLATATAQLAVQMGIQPQKMFQQLANLSGDVVKHFGGSRKQLMKALSFATRLNLTIQDMAATAQGFMDIQNSIANVMQLQALTGKEIDIGEILRLSYSGKDTQAVALYIKQLGSAFNTNNKILLQTMSKSLNMPVDKIKSVANEIQKSGGDINKILQQSAIDSVNTVENAAEGNLKAITTSAYALQTPFQAIGRRIQNIILEHFRPIIKYILDNTDLILKYFDKFVAFLGKVIKMFIEWLERPSVQQGIANFFLKAYEIGKKLLEQVIIPIFKFLGKVYEKGGVLGLLGLVAAIKVLMNLPAIISAISGAVGIFSAKAAAVPTMMAGGVGAKVGPPYENWVQASGYSKEKYQSIKASKGTQAAQAYKNKMQSKGQTIMSQQADKANQAAEAGSGVADKAGKFASGADSVLKLAQAVAILASALWLVAKIPSDKLLQSTIAIGALLGALTLASKFVDNKGGINVIFLAIGVGILSGALWVVAQVPSDQLWESVLAIGALLGALTLASKFVGAGGSVGLILLAVATLILAVALKAVANIPFDKLMKAAGAIGIFVVELTAIAFGLQLAAPFIMVGIGVLMAMGIALIVFSKGMQQATKILQAGITAEDIKSIGEMMQNFSRIVGKSMKALVDQLGNVSMKQAKVAMKMIGVFNELINSLKLLYEISKQPGAIKNITGALTELADSNVGQKVGQIMKQLATQLQGTKKKTAESVSAMLGSFGDFIGGLGKLADLYKDPKNKLDFASILQGLTSQGPKGQKSVVDMMTDVMGELIKVVDTKGQEVKTKTTEALKGMMESFSSFIDILTKLKDLDLAKIGQSIGLFVPQVSTLGDSMKGLSDKLKEGKNYDPKLIDKLSNSLKKLSQSLLALNKNQISSSFKNSLQEILKLFKTYTAHVNNFALAIKAVYEAFEKLKNIDSKNLKTTIEGAIRIQAIKSMGLATQATAYSKVSESMVANLNKIVQGKYAEGGIVRTPQIALIGQNGPQAVVPLNQSNYSPNNRLTENNSVEELKEFVKAIKETTNKPIQIILNVDGRKLAEVVANNTTPSYNLG